MPKIDILNPGAAQAHGPLLSEEDLAQSCGLPAHELAELVQFGVLAPAAGEAGHRFFQAALVPPLREAVRLRVHFDLEPFAVVVLVPYLERIAALERRVRELESHLPHLGASREGPGSWHEPHDAR